jgi:hypothetical protein
MLFGKQKDKYEKRTVELAKQCKDIAEQKQYRDYFIEEQNTRMERKQNSLKSILDECKKQQYNSLENFRNKIKELAETGIKY